MSDTTLHVFHLGLMDYETVWHAMQHYTDTRDDNSPDELWLVEHPPVFTQGQAGKAEHILATGDIPVVQVDRGGQVTYHGPGQMVAYPLLNVRKLKIGVRQLVTDIEQSVVEILSRYRIDAYPKADAPGVYVEGKKIASLGLRIRRGCSFHGVAFNVDMDLEPFHRINPCGYAGLEMTQSKALGGPATVEEASRLFSEIFSQRLGYQQLQHHQGLPES
ncbi:lipoyl(octanoyl) transferase LipB [Shewanella sp. YIC-542]|uniref:lipoyl(octanoyl) transferase LipB n=1 Tax=Shewanella mytili TaxID=3377111 RepID=UPI00398E7CED